METFSKFKYSYGLLDNARQFLESAVKHALTSDVCNWKFALLHITTALELLVKARIAQENPHFIARGNIDYLHFERGMFHSINIDEAIKCLKKTIGFSLSAKQRHVLDKLKASRNRLVHFIDQTNEKETKALVAAGLGLFFEIHETEFQNEEDPYGAKSMTELAEELSKLSDFIDYQMASLVNKLKEANRPRTHHFSECQRCLQEADVIDANNLICLFCGDKISIRDATKLISDDESVGNCPLCNRSSVAKHQLAKDKDPTYECFCCGYYRGPEIIWCDAKGNNVPRLRAFS